MQINEAGSLFREEFRQWSLVMITILNTTEERSQLPRPVTSQRPSIRQRVSAWITARSEASSERMLGTRKFDLFRDIAGTIVEIGPGTGVNLHYYPAGTRWIAVEPNPAMHSQLRERARQYDIEADLRQESAEDIDLPDGVADAVVSTLVLCSVENLERVLQEVHRVLKPGGHFIFLEHVAAEEGTRQRRNQDLIQPVWSFFGNGCRPNRETAAALKKIGFEKLEYSAWRLDVPITSPMIAGVATKREHMVDPDSIPAWPPF
jgi:SAM-dependent methyltransferase